MARPRVTLVLNTYRDFRDSAEPVIEWMNEVLRLTERLAAISATTARTHDARILALLRDSDRMTRRKLTPANWAIVQRRLRSGEIDTVWFEYEPDLAFEVAADLDPRLGRQYHLFVELALLPDGISSELQSEFVHLLQIGARLLDAATGYLTVDVFPCPYEVVMGCEQANRERYEEQVRGYYWGNILSSSHVARLGGVDVIRAKAPCAVISDLSGDGKLVYLQSSQRLTDWSRDEVMSLRDYFRPLLPGGSPVPSEAEKTARVIEGGVRPERPPEPGTRYRRFLDEVQRRTGESPPAVDLVALRAESSALSSGPARPFPIVTTAELFLELMEITVFFADVPNERDLGDLARLVEIWAEEGVGTGFGPGVMHSVDRPSFTLTDTGTPAFGFLADLGSAGQPALDELLSRFARFAGSRELNISRVLLGHGGLDP